MRNLLLFFLYILVANFYLPGQPYKITDFGAKEELPYGNFNSVLADNKGFVWITHTGMGLIKYNGKDFKVFNKRNGLLSADVVCCYIDGNDTVFAGSFLGVNVIYNDSVLHSYNLDSEYSCGPVRAITKDEYGNLWVVTNKGMLINIKSGKVNKVDLPEAYASIPDICCMSADAWGNIWIGSYSGVFIKYHPDSGSVEDLTSLPAFNNTEILALVRIHKKMLVVTSEGTFTVSGKNVLLVSETYFSKKYGKYLAGVGYDFVISTLENGKINDFKHFTFDIPVFNNLDFSDLLYAHGLFFLATTHGFYELDPDVKIYPVSSSAGTSPVLKVVAYSDGKVWAVGNVPGYFKNDTFHPAIQKDSVSIVPHQVYDLPDKLYFSSTSSYLFYELDKRSNTVRLNKYLTMLRKKSPTTSITGNDAFTLIVSGNNLILVAHGDTVYYTFEGQKSVEKTNKLDFSVSGPYVRDVYTGKDSTAWIATTDGLWYYKNGDFHAPGNDGLLKSYFYDIVEDDSGNVWFSSANGIIRYSPFTGSFTRISMDNASAVDFSHYSKLMYHDGFLYVSFVKYKIKDDSLIYQGKIILHKLFRGLKYLDFYDCAVDNDGYFWFPYKNNVTGIPLNKVSFDDLQKTSTYINRVTVYSENFSETFLVNNGDTLTLDADKDNITVFFDTPLFGLNTSGSYRYASVLDPGMTKYINVVKNSNVSYSITSPGTYTLQIFLNNAPVKTLPAKITIIKLPKFYQTLFFKVIVIIVIVLIILLIVKINTTIVKKKEARKRELKQQIAELQIKALQAQMNPHFIFNTLNSIQYLLAYDKTEQAFEAIDIFSRLIRKTLEFISASFISIREEVEYLVLYLEVEKLRFEDKFEYEIVYDRIDDIDTPVLPPLIVQPFAENAIKHGLLGSEMPNKKLTIVFEQTDNAVVITIEDNGKGFDVEGYKQPDDRQHGIALVAEKLEIYGTQHNKKYRLDIKSVPGKGTKITLTIPL